MTPASFREDLKRFDKRLDFEYSPFDMCWQVVGYDRKNVKYIIKNIPIGKVDTIGPWVLQDLYEFSPNKQGGAKELNRKIDEKIEQEEAKKEQEMRDSISALHEDAYIHLKHQIGQRVSFHKPKEREATSTVSDRRRVHAQQEEA